MIRWLVAHNPVPEATAPPDSGLKPTVKVKIVTPRKQIVEAPLPSTQAVPDEAFLSGQNRKTDTPTRLPPQALNDANRAADASAIKSQGEANSKSQKTERSELPAYAQLLPSGGQGVSVQVDRPARNDFIDDETIPIGDVLDVNTTDYRYLGYITLIRKQVEQAFYSPLSALKDEEHVRERLRAGEVSRHKGSSVALMRISRIGMLSHVEIVDSSGDKTVDEEWLRILNLAAPFPPLPKNYGPGEFKLRYTLFYDFTIRENRKLRHFQF